MIPGMGIAAAAAAIAGRPLPHMPADPPHDPGTGPTASVPLSEVFGPTWQGEGPHTGRVVSFVRLGLCNLSCEWCDTPFTWDRSRFDVKAENPDTPIAAIHDAIRGHGTDTVVLTGGEPMIHRHRFADLCDPAWGWHLETNGTIAPDDVTVDRITHASVSPKINTRDPFARRLKPRALSAWAEHAQDGWVAFKFVVRDEFDLARVSALVDDLGLDPGVVWVMPEGTTAAAVVDTHRVIAPAVLAAGFRTTTRLHTLLWDDQKGH